MHDYPSLDPSHATREELAAEVERLRAELRQRSAPSGEDAARPSDMPTLPAEFETLLRSSGIGFAVVDLDETIVLANHGAERILGMERNGLAGRHLQEFITGDDWDRLRAETERRRDGESSTYDLAMRGKDGTRRQILVHAIPQVNTSGVVTGTIAIYTDITAHRKADRARKESEARLAALFDASPIPSLVWHVRKDLTTLEAANPSALRLLHLERVDPNLPVTSLLPRASEIQDLIDEARSTGSPQHREYQLDENHGAWGEWEVRVVPLPRDRLLMLVEDIGERKQTARLQAALRDIAMAMTNVSEPNIVLDTCLNRMREFLEADALGLYRLNAATEAFSLDHVAGNPDTLSRQMPVLPVERPFLKGVVDGEVMDFSSRDFLSQDDQSDDLVAFRAAPVKRWQRVTTVLCIAYEGREFCPAYPVSTVGALTEQLGQILERLDAEIRLRASEEKFRSIAENIPGAVYVYRYTADGRRVDQYLGPGLDDVIGPERVGDGPDGRGDIDRIEERAHPSDRRDAIQSSRKAEQSGDYYDRLFRVRDLNGAHRWIRSIGRPKHEPDGSVLWRGVLLDVHRETLAEQKLVDSEQRYRLLADNTADVIFTINTTMTLTYVSPSAARMFAVRNADSLIRLPLRRFLNTRGLRRVVRQRKRFSAHMSAADVDALHLRDEYELQRMDGSQFWAEVVTSPLLDDERTVSGFVGIIRDISERRDAEEALRGSEQRFRSIFEHSPLGIATVSADGFRFLSANTSCCTMTGYSREDLLGLALTDLLGPDDVRHAARLAHGFGRSGQEQAWEFELLRRDDTTVWVNATSSVLNQPGDRAPAIILILEDISQRKQAEAAIVAANRLEATATLAGGLAHDINNLMSGVMGYAELLEMETAGDANARSMLREITSSAREAGDLAQSMIAFSRQGKVRELPFDLNLAVSEILETQRRDLNDGVTLHVDLDPAPRMVAADPAQMRQMVLNILRNALEAVQDTGEVMVQTRTVRLQSDNPYNLDPGPYLELQVRDTGPGMTQDELKHVFEPFYSKKFVGRGMGMAAVYGIVRNHGGGIYYISRPGAGTRAHVALPALEE